MVYLDGNYIGLSPCSFKKVPGVHVIILRKTGYETKSYTVQVDSDSKDASYSFAELVRSGDDEDEGDGQGETASEGDGQGEAASERDGQGEPASEEDGQDEDE